MINNRQERRRGIASIIAVFFIVSLILSYSLDSPSVSDAETGEGDMCIELIDKYGIRYTEETLDIEVNDGKHDAESTYSADNGIYRFGWYGEILGDAFSEGEEEVDISYRVTDKGELVCDGKIIFFRDSYSDEYGGYMGSEKITVPLSQFHSGSVYVTDGKSEEPAYEYIRDFEISDGKDSVRIDISKDSTYDTAGTIRKSRISEVTFEETEYTKARNFDSIPDDGRIVLERKWTAGSDAYEIKGDIYSDGDRIYAKKDAELTVTAGDGYSVCSSYTDKGSESTVFRAGSPFYVRNSSGEVSCPVYAVTVDSTPPEITDIDTGTKLRMNDYGMFSRPDEDISIRITARDECSGVAGSYIEISGEEESIRIDPESEKTSDGIFTSEFVIPEKEAGYSGTIYIILTDNTGNTTDKVPLREDEKKSGIYIEDTEPVIGSFKVDGRKNSNFEWAYVLESASYSVSDNLSGIHNIEILVDGEVIFSDSPEGLSLTESGSINLKKYIKNKSGKLDFKIRVTDNAGNITESGETCYVDSEKPAVEITGAEDGSKVSSFPDIHIAASDDSLSENTVHVTVSAPKGTKEVCYRGEKNRALNELIEDIDKSVDGRYIISAYSVDPAGNVSEGSEVGFFLDTKGPAIYKIKIKGRKSEAGWYSSSLDVGYGASDSGCGIRSIRIAVNGRVIAESEKLKGKDASDVDRSITLTRKQIREINSANGRYIISITASDNAGNVSTSEKTVRIDIEKPVVSLSGIINKASYSRNPCLCINLSEEFYQYSEITISGTRDGKSMSKTVRKGTRSFRKAFLRDGRYSITVDSVDAAGNRAVSKKITFIRDSNPPEVSLSGAENGEYYASGRTVEIDFSDRFYRGTELTVEVKRTLDGESSYDRHAYSARSRSDSRSIVCSETGTYTVIAYAKDRAGNTSKSRTVKFTVDNDKPVIDIKGLEDGKTYGFGSDTTAAIEIKESYPGSSYIAVRKDGKSITSEAVKERSRREAAVEITDDAVHDGNYEIQVVSVDRSGNRADRTIAFSVNRFGSDFSYGDYAEKINGRYLTRVVSDIVITERNVSDVTKCNVSVTLDGEEQNAVEKRTETEKGWKEYTHVLDKSQFEEEGLYEIVITSRDSSGNISRSSQRSGVLKFAVDRTEPEISVSGIDDNMISDSDSIEAEVVFSDNMAVKSYFIFVNGKQVASDDRTDGKLDESTAFIISEGKKQNVRITALDVAGNSRTVQFKGITVSKSTLTRVTSNGPLLAGIVFGIVVIIVLSMAITRGRNRKKC